MVVMEVHHQVADYDAWKKVFDSYAPLSRGALFYRINRGVDDPNTLLVVHGFRSTAEANAYRDDPVLKETMRGAGVTSAPRFEIYDEVESSQA